MYFYQVLRASLELGQVKQEIDRRIAEKEEEFENSRLDLNDDFVKLWTET